MKKNKGIMKITISLLICLFCLTSIQHLKAEEIIDAKLVNIEVEDIDSKNIKVIITTTIPVYYKYFRLNDPPVLSVDLIRTIHPLPASNLEVEKGMVKLIRSAQNRLKPKKITRVAIDLAAKDVPYIVTKVENKITISIGPAFGEDKKEGQEEVIAQEVVEQPANEKEEISVSEIEEKTDVVEQEVIEEKTIEESLPAVSGVESNPEMEVKIPEVTQTSVSQPDEIIVEENKEEKINEEVIIPETETKTEEVKEVPIDKIEEVINKDTKEEEAIKEEEKTETETEEKEELITLNFKDADIRDVLRILSLKSGINMVYGDDVSGNITIHLDKVSFGNAFDIILGLKGLTYEKVASNVYRIATPAVIAAERAVMITATEVFAINYAKASEISPSLSSMLSSQGKIQVDIRTNSLIITDAAANLKKIADMIKALDIATPQVVIEAQIVEIGNSDLQYLGINWTASKTIPYKEGQSTDVTLGMLPAGPTFGGGAEGTLTIASVMSKAQLNATLSALATKGKSKVLSNPKISTINNKEARILVGDRVPYSIITNTPMGWVKTTAYIDVGIRLLVTPTINPNNIITLKIHPEVSFVKEWRQEAPVIATREADTEVLIKSGETIVIAGLIKEEDRQDTSKVPFLGEIPILRYLFSQKLNDKTKTELLIFITPMVLGEE